MRFVIRDPKKGSPGSVFHSPAHCGARTQDVAVLIDDDDAICCVQPLPCDRPITTGKGRCGYSVCVVHFRKFCINQKVGSAGNDHPII